MKKINILKFTLGLSVLLSPMLSKAQDMGHYDKNFYADYVGQRVSVSAPASLATTLDFTITNDGSGSTNEWGAAISAPMIDVDVVKANPYLGCGNPGTAVSGKIALILRGDCEFSAKAKNAQAAGAVAVVIVNHTTGGPVEMGAGSGATGVNIPVLMISKEQGDVISAAIDGGQNVKMTLTRWGNNLAHDLGILKSGVSMWHNYSTPGNQFVNGGSNDEVYKGINGAVIGNFGTSDETNVKLRTILTFTPNGGTATELRRDSIIRPTFAVGDSVISPFVNEYYTLMNSATPGRYDLTYNVTADAPDDLPTDNTVTYSFYVDSRIFSKSRYDFAKFKPISTIGYSFSNNSAFMWGPMYHVAKGGNKIEMVQFGISKSGTDSNIAPFGSMNIIVWKWKDGTNGQAKDNVVQSGEVTAVGIATRKFVDGDTSGQVFTVPVTDAFDPNKPVVSEDNTDYWVTAVVPDNAFLLCDGQLNYQVRAFDRYRSNQFTELYAPIYSGVNDAFTASATNTAQSFPFETSNQADSARFSQQRKGTVPSISMIMGFFPSSVKSAGTIQFSMDVYPNPARDNLKFSVKLGKAADLFSYTIVSADGRVIMSDKYHNILNQEFNVSVQSLPAGNYYLIATADDKAVTRPFSVIK